MPNVTLFKTITDTTRPVLQPVDKVLEYIRDGRWKDKIERIRNSHDEDEVSSLKAELPCILYAGEFTIEVENDKGQPTYRKDECLSKHSHLVPIDIDDVDNIDDVIDSMKRDQFVHAIWKSPSGKGCHGLIKIGDGKSHRRHYNSIIKRYKILDTTARNESRILFVSYDPELYYNKHSSVFYDVEDDQEVTSTGELSINGSGTTDYKKIDVAVLLGGYIAAGKVEREVAESILYHEICKRDIKDAASAKGTIGDGITYGMLAPIHQTEQAFSEALDIIKSVEDELSFLSSSDDDELYIRKFRQGLIETGKGFGYHKLDEYLVLKEGEFYGFVAHSNVGKTTVIMRFINDHFYFISNDKTYDYMELLGFAESLSRHKSLKGIFIDPYNSLKSNVTASKSKYQYDYEAYSDMLSFTNRTKITLFLSAHTNTEAQRLLDNDGNQKMPHATMVEGGVALYNKCHNFVVFHRKIKDPNEWMYTQPVLLRMQGGVEFLEDGRLPFDRDFLPTYES